MKDKFEDLDEDFKDSIAAMDEDAIRSTIAKVSLNQVEMMNAKAGDQDLIQKREAASEAGAVYREGTKMNKLRIEFCHQVLGDKAKDTGSFDPESP